MTSASRVSRDICELSAVSPRMTTLRPGRGGPTTSAEDTSLPLGVVTVAPCLSLEYSGPGGTPRHRAFSANSLGNSNSVEPQNRGHFGANSFVPISEGPLLDVPP